MKKIISTGMLAGAFLFGIVSCNQQQGAVEEAQEVNEQQAQNTGMEDQMTNISDFMTKAASNSMLEVEAGRLAQDRAQNQQVKEYGKMMVADHTKANEQMKQLAQQKNVTLPDSLGQDHKDQLQSLQDKKGREFDQEYMDLMVSSHEEAVTLFEDASNNIQDAEVKSFATTTLPKLREHLDRANQIDSTMQQKQQ
ncbi:DUF4142 domain-containing protein [Pontibacter korlensis]|uniref:Membrane protein n=1 Tax=Pontibacter korlensis TaxID=400092 RepID=A0A0E3ZD90_9BACT|nr:DUF4142 domain-containing protein [Pontibacter korlensis]AKD02945.1 membrane protein [Pontibacter korlensis]